MTRRLPTWMAYTTWLAATVLAVGAVAFATINRQSPHTTLLFTIGQATLALLYPTVGAVVAVRRPRNPIGWILLAIGLGQGLSAFGSEYAVAAVLGNPRGLPPADILGWISNWVWAPTLGLMVTFLLLLFPDGHLPSRRWRPLAWLSAGTILVTVGSIMVALWPQRGTLLLSDDRSGSEALSILFNVGVLAVAACGIGSIASLVVRFRRSAGTERQQLKWITYGGTLTAVAVGVSFAGLEGILGFLLAAPFLAMPLAIGVAILRYRLYDIDRVINKTLVYVLTVVLAGVYAGSAIGLGAAFRGLTGQSSSLAVAASTLLVAALFGPARRRVRPSSTDGSTGGGTTHSGRSRRSLPACGTRSTSTSSHRTWSPRSRARFSLSTRGCGSGLRSTSRPVTIPRRLPCRKESTW
jgi:hypothetical protein